MMVYAILTTMFNQTRFAFARILATTGPTVTQLIPTLMANLLAHFEPSELVDFINFIGLLIHKLQVRPKGSITSMLIYAETSAPCNIRKNCLTLWISCLDPYPNTLPVL